MRTYNDDKIRDRAFQLWDEAGQPEGREQEFWFQAASWPRTTMPIHPGTQQRSLNRQ
jgi:hypothetical protein